MSRADEEAAFLILGNGWVSRNCYGPAVESLGRRAITLDTAPENGGAQALEKALDLARRRDDLVIVVATPNASHWPLARTFLGTANRVLVEKPLSLPDEADHEDLDAEAMSRLFVSTPYRHRPDVASLRALVAAGKIGDVRNVTISWKRKAGIPRPGSWYTNKRLAGGGVLVDLGPHLLDIALDIAGWPAVTVTGCELTQGNQWAAGSSRWMQGTPDDNLPCDVEIAAALQLSDCEGRRIAVNVAWASDVTEDTTIIEIVGSLDRVQLTTLFGFAPGRAVGTFSGAATGEIAIERKPQVDFARMLTTLDSGEAATGRQGRAVMDVIACAYRLAESSSTTEVPR